MRAIVYTRYGPPEVLHMAEVQKPAPKDNEVRIKIHATTATPGDCVARSGAFPALWWLPMRLLFGISKPKRRIPGSELAGEIESIGKAVTLFHKGEPVFAEAGFGLGAYAEYICLPERGLLAKKPANITYEQAAAAVDGPVTAMHFLRKGHIGRGSKVLINGASGSVGTYAVQLAKHFGAEVTGVCSTGNVALVESLGADTVIDYTKEDFTGNGQLYDIIFDAVGRRSFKHCKSSLSKKGVYLTTVPTLAVMLQMIWTSLSGNKKVITGIPSENPEGLLFIKGLIETGKLEIVIDRRYPMEQIADAHRYVEKGHKKGNVVVTIAPDDE